MDNRMTRCTPPLVPLIPESPWHLTPRERQRAARPAASALAIPDGLGSANDRDDTTAWDRTVRTGHFGVSGKVAGRWDDEWLIGYNYCCFWDLIDLSVRPESVAGAHAPQFWALNFRKTHTVCP